MTNFIEAISEYIWDVKYRYRLPEKIVDETIEATWLRVAKAVAQAEPKNQRSAWQKKFYTSLYIRVKRMHHFQT